MKTLFYAGATLATILLSVSAIAQGPGGPPPGPQTRDQYLAAQKARFAGLDANGDGVVTKAEMSAAIEKRMGSAPPAQMIDGQFARMDTDGDGKATAAEADAAAAARFTALDTDKNGTLTPEEQAAGRPPRPQ